MQQREVIGIRQHRHRFGLIVRHTHYAAVQPIRARQQRQWPAVGETLERLAIGCATAGHGRHHQRLLVIGDLAANAQRRAHETLAAIGTYQQTRSDRLLAAFAVQTHPPMIRAGLQRQHLGRAITGQRRQGVHRSLQRLTEITRHHHTAESLATVIVCVQPYRAKITGTTDVDALHRCRWLLEVPEHRQSFQRVEAGIGQHQIALVEARPCLRAIIGRDRFDQRYIQAAAIQGTGQARANQTAADDYDVVLHVSVPQRRHPTCMLHLMLGSVAAGYGFCRHPAVC